MNFLLALQFLTRIPIFIHGTVTEKNMARSMAYYPLVGLLIGGMAALLHRLLTRYTAGSLADLAVVILLVMITGNMHFDGLLDTADGLGSGKTREQALEIMRDSRVGAHGVVAGILVILTKIILLGAIQPPYKIPALLLFPVFGRWAMVYASACHRYIRTRGLGTFTACLGKGELLAASILTLLIAVVLLQVKALLLAAIVLAGTALLCFYLVRKAGGMTGDFYGAINESMEVLTLFALSFFLP